MLGAMWEGESSSAGATAWRSGGTRGDGAQQRNAVDVHTGGQQRQRLMDPPVAVPKDIALPRCARCRLSGFSWPRREIGEVPPDKKQSLRSLLGGQEPFIPSAPLPLFWKSGNTPPSARTILLKGQMMRLRMMAIITDAQRSVPSVKIQETNGLKVGCIGLFSPGQGGGGIGTCRAERRVCV